MPATESSKTHLFKRCLLLLAGLLVMSFGVAFSIKANLGTSPIASVPYVVSRFVPLTVGNVSILLQTLFVLIQILLLRRRYRPLQLLQLATAVIFGYLTDLALWCLRGVTPGAYWQQWLVCLAGITLIGVGVSLEVGSGTVPLAGEGMVLALCQVLPLKFGNMKVAFDVTLVAIACAVSLLVLHKLVGVREGTLAAAILVGIIAKWCQKRLARLQLSFCG